MLLGVAVRNPSSKLHPSVVTALQTSLHRYLIGLFNLSKLQKMSFNSKVKCGSARLLIHVVRGACVTYLNQELFISLHTFSDPKSDQYLARCLRELISIYLPKILVLIKSSDELPLLKFFEEKPENEIPERALVLELIVSTFLSKRNRTPDSSVTQVKTFYINQVIIPSQFLF